MQIAFQYPKGKKKRGIGFWKHMQIAFFKKMSPFQLGCKELKVLLLPGGGAQVYLNALSFLDSLLGLF